MAPRTGRQRTIAAPAGLAVATALAFLPGAASPATGATASAVTAPAAPASAGTRTGPELSYVVNTIATGRGTVRSVERSVADAGGKVVVSHGRIGVIVVHSRNPDFARLIREVKGVRSAGATRTAPMTSVETTDVGRTRRITAAEAAEAAAAAEPGQEPLEPNQWSLAAVKADRAHAVSTGSAEVTVGVIDTGVDDTHPDLAPNFSRDQSANCVGGVADGSEGAWRPYPDGSDHGTHVAGTIAAARNGIGVAGVAPGVKVAGIKVSEPGSGLFYTEAVVCGVMWAADHGVEVTNNSYYVDPWYFNCKDDPDQKALLESLTRAVRYAERRGTVHIAAAGNENYDLASAAILDPSSPNDSTPADRTVDPSECFDIPAQLPGVVTVAATGARNLKSYYSSYGLGTVDVAAPGGDGYQVPGTPDANGRILSTIPGGYGYKQGTSMATPHVAAVAALIRSTHPRATAAQVRLLLTAQADNPGCPTGLYDPDGDGAPDSTCEGGERMNGFYGHGIVDALDAVGK